MQKEYMNYWNKKLKRNLNKEFETYRFVCGDLGFWHTKLYVFVKNLRFIGMIDGENMF